MKVTLMIVGLALIGLTSCKKDYTCACTYVTNQQYVDGSGNAVPGTQQTATTSDSRTITDKEDVATAECTGANGTVTQSSVIGGGIYLEQKVTTTCTISEK